MFKKIYNTLFTGSASKIGIWLLAAVVVSQSFLFYKVGYSDKDKEYFKYINQEHKIFSFPIPETVDFAGEAMPVKDIEVRERLNKEIIVNAYWQSQTILLLQRANRWFPIIEPILKQNNIPDDFKYLCVAESAMANVVSPSGAAGFWQFMKGTAPQYGLHVGDEVDERYNLEKATQAACDYLQEAKVKNGTWTAAAAGYNMGMQGVNNQMSEQGTTNFYDLYLNDETSRYVFRITALKLIMSNPKQYGFYVRQQDKYPTIPFKNVTVGEDGAINWVAVAKENGISYKLLKYCNPWIRKINFANKSKHSYTIKIPTETDATVLQKQLGTDDFSKE